MLILLPNLPADVTSDDIETLCQHANLVNNIHMVEYKNSNKVSAWIELDCGRVGLNAACDVLNSKYIHGHHIMAYPSLYSH